MLLLDLFTKRGKRITLSVERWNHLIGRHPEMSQYLPEIPTALQDPEIIVQNNTEPAILLYHKYYKVEGLFLVIVVEEEKGFIITGYTTVTPKRGRIIWKK